VAIVIVCQFLAGAQGHRPESRKSIEFPAEGYRFCWEKEGYVGPQVSELPLETKSVLRFERQQICVEKAGYLT
jgi:hypothetical protein